MSATKTPLVSVVIAARNEERRIGECIASFAAQTYPLDRMEIIVADGQSTDRTRMVVEDFAPKCGLRVVLLENPQQVTPSGMNLGISRAMGEVVLIYSAHAVADPDLVRLCVEKLLAQVELGGVGGRVVFLGETYVSRAIAAARSSPLGGGLSPYRYSSAEQYVQTVPYAAYRRAVLCEVGMFDEKLVRNQDNELNARILKAGYRLLYSPEIVSHYYGRTSAHQLARQMYQYGFWKLVEYKKDISYFRVSEVIPLAFVVGLPVLVAGSALIPEYSLACLAVLALYMLVLLAGALRAIRKHGLLEALAVPLVLAVIHLSVGVGELRGLLHVWADRHGEQVSS